MSKGGGRGGSGGTTKGGWCGPITIVGALTVGVSLLLVPLATRVWTTEIVPAANRVHFGDGLVVALSLAMFALYLLTSVLFVRRRPTAVAVIGLPAAADGATTTGASEHPVAPAPRPAEGRATGRGVTPGGAA